MKKFVKIKSLQFRQYLMFSLKMTRAMCYGWIFIGNERDEFDRKVKYFSNNLEALATGGSIQLTEALYRRGFYSPSGRAPRASAPDTLLQQYDRCSDNITSGLTRTRTTPSATLVQRVIVTVALEARTSSSYDRRGFH